MKIVLFKNQLQLNLFSLLWLCYAFINTITTSFLNTEKFSTEIILHSLLYATGGIIFSFGAYKTVRFLRIKVKSNFYFLLLTSFTVYLATFLWMISHHLSWWIVSGDEVLVIRPEIYPLKALMYSIITLAVVLLLILTEKKLWLIEKSNEGNAVNSKSVGDLPEKKELAYDDTIFIPAKNRMLNVKIDTIKLIQANDYYTNVYSYKYDKTIVSNYSLKKWGETLPGEHFLRIHRSFMVNLNYVENIEKMKNNTYKVKIKGLSQDVDMSRRYAKNILDRFKL